MESGFCLNMFFEKCKFFLTGSGKLGVGRTAPGAFKTMDDGVIVPMGDSITTSDKPSTLLYNE